MIVFELECIKWCKQLKLQLQILFSMLKKIHAVGIKTTSIYFLSLRIKLYQNLGRTETKIQRLKIYLTLI